MKDLLEAALFDAGIKFNSVENSSNKNVNDMQDLPRLQRMTDYNLPTSSGYKLCNQICGGAAVSKPLAVIRNDQKAASQMSNTHRISYQPLQLQRTIVTSNGRRFIVIAPQEASNRRPPLLRPPGFENHVTMQNSANLQRRFSTPNRVVRHMVQPVRPMISAKKPQIMQPKKQILQPIQQPKMIKRRVEITKEHEEIEEDEKLIQVDTFIEYTPLKLRSGLRHPDPVVETASLSSVSAPEIRYHMSIPEEIIDSGKISALQLEAALYACQAHEKKLPSGERVGYLIGDGAGVGKGRTIATVIYENYLLGRRRSVWISVSADLFYDAERDLRDIGANIDVHRLSTMKYSNISGDENGNIRKGVIFLTYSALVCEIKKKDGKDSFNRINSRLEQLVQWCGPDFDGLIVFDECHHAKNLMPLAGTKPTKTGKLVLKLQNELPNARVIYASATGATEPRNMAYMTRLGLWGPGQTFPDFADFVSAVENRGSGSLELIAIDMKLRGLYLARQLSFAGVDFSVQEVLLTSEFIQMYDKSVKLWMEVRRQFQYAIEHTRTSEGNQGRVWSFFWSAHQRFFKSLCIGAKVQACVRLAKQALAEGKCVVIGLQITGESQTKKVLDDVGEITDFVSTTKAILQSLIEKHFPVGDSDSADIFEDMSKMHTIGSGGNNFTNGRKRPLSGVRPVAPAIKRRTYRNSTGSPNEDEQSTDSDVEDEGSEVSTSEDNSICAGLESDSSSIDDEDDDFNSEPEEDGNFASKSKSVKTANNNLTEDNLFKTLMCELDDTPDLEVDPFHHDFSSAIDPWAHLQTNEEPLTDEQQQELEKVKRKKLENRRKIRQRERREERRKKRKLEEMRLRDEQIKLQRQRELNVDTATDFMKSTRLIDNNMETGDSFSLMTIKAELLTAIERIGKTLPPNTLDQLIDELGGTQHVAEMTGRKGRIVILPSGQAEYQLRNADSDAAVEKMNMEEKDKFMRGEKLIAVISEAASSGISLQSDKRVENKRRRVHITLELPWSADKAVQQFGRTHRSNQVSAPEYVFLISELAGEKRFASVVAKRLECLGALTHGDRRAGESRDLSQFNLDNKYGRDALQDLIKTLADPSQKPTIPAPADYALGADKFFDDMREYLVGVGVLTINKNNPNRYVPEKDGATLPKFLNRLLGLPVHAQNALFSYFTNIINELIKRAKANGTFDKGIMDLGSGSDNAKKIEHRVFRGFAGNPNFVVEIHKIGAERGVNWEDAKAMYDAQTDVSCGFYSSKPIPDRKQTVVLVINSGKSSVRNLSVVRPNTGRSSKTQAYAEIIEKFTRIKVEDAAEEWKRQYEAFSQMCLHRFVNGQCKKEDAQDTKEFCEFGRRFRTYFVLTGSVIAVWPMLEKALHDVRHKQQATYMQIVRIRTDDNQKLVGLLVLPSHVRPILTALTKMCTDNK